MDEDDILNLSQPSHPCSYLEYKPKTEARRIYALETAINRFGGTNAHDLIMLAYVIESYLEGKYMSRFKLPEATVHEFNKDKSKAARKVLPE